MSGGIPPARCISTGMQLIYVKRIWHISKIYDIFSSITHFANRFMQCSQNTVVSFMRSIQRCIFLRTGRIFYTPVNDGPCSDGIIHDKRNERNNHEYLTEIRKSEKSLQCSDWHTMIEADMRNNCNNFNEEKRRKTTKLKTQVESTIIFKIISGITKVLCLQRPLFFFNLNKIEFLCINNFCISDNITYCTTIYQRKMNINSNEKLVLLDILAFMITSSKN